MKNRGFTLIELSMVLVIIGLVIGGILVGQDLIQAARLRSIVSDKEKYITAVNTFKTKYNYLPGDMPNATDYWGASAGCPWTMSQWTPTATCNGDGDGNICAGDVGSADGSCPTEGLYVFHHMMLAGLVPGNYVNLVSGPPYTPGFDIAESKAFPGAGYEIFHWGGNANSLLFFSFAVPQIQHVITFGAKDPARTNNWVGNAFYPILTTKDALSIDAKIDDGKPGMGTVMSFPHSIFNANCTNAADGSAYRTAIYDLSQSGIQCALIFVAKF